MASGDAVNFSSNVAGLITCQENEDRGNFGRLGGAPEDSLSAEMLHLFLGHSRGDEWSPDGTRGYGIDANPLLDRQAGKRPREADDGRFGRGVGNETRTGIEGLDRRSVNNGSALFHLWKDRLAEAEHGEHIHAIRFLELIIGNVLEFFVGPLKGGIIDEDVNSA